MKRKKIISSTTCVSIPTTSILSSRLTREIKFRLWNNQSRKWDSEPYLKMWQIPELRNGRLYLHILGSLDNGWMELSQFTGILDKNGKEVYEGDILYLKDYFRDIDDEEYDLQGQVVFENGSFMVKPKMFPLWILFEDKFEIIGNIYENPELIEKFQTAKEPE